MFNPSPHQSAIFEWLAHGSGSLLVDAKAGSGKTTTLVEGLRCLPLRNPGELTPPRIRFLAFNKMIAETLQQRCPKHVVCSTFHSLGLSALRGILGRDFKIESGKVRKLVYNACSGDDPDIQGIIKLVGLAKTLVPDAAGVTVDWMKIIAQYDMLFDDPQNAVRVAASVLKASNADLTQIDFDDMLYLPVLLNAPFDWQDWVFVDEAQDTNDIQAEILWRLRRVSGRAADMVNTAFTASPMSETTTRFVFIGDPHQAIYGFRGANADAMTKLGKRFGATTLPLSVSYRCSLAVIKEAQKTVPEIEAAPNALLGLKDTLKNYTADAFQPGFGVLCRNNAPLVAFAYSLLQRDVPCRILGKDIGASLISLVKKMRAANLEDLQTKLAKWCVREANRLAAEGRSPESVYDQHECLRWFITSLDEDSQSVASCIAKIELMFTDDTKTSSSRVTLSSIHKSKGLEYSTVFILDRDLLPSKFATQPWQRKQEENLLYVAQTRTKLNLFYINSDNWKQENTEN